MRAVKTTLLGCIPIIVATLSFQTSANTITATLPDVYGMSKIHSPQHKISTTADYSCRNTPRHNDQRIQEGNTNRQGIQRQQYRYGNGGPSRGHVRQGKREQRQLITN
jgi:hypothetical protein